MTQNPFSRKTYGRIFVQKPEHIQIVKDTIKEVDEFEYEYMPSDLVAVYPDEKGFIYLHKFEIDKDELTKSCIAKGVWIWCVDGQGELYSV